MTNIVLVRKDSLNGLGMSYWIKWINEMALLNLQRFQTMHSLSTNLPSHYVSFLPLRSPVGLYLLTPTTALRNKHVNDSIYQLDERLNSYP